MGNGGGLQVKTGSLTAYAGRMTFTSCKAAGAGGGADVGRNIRLEASVLAFDKCKAGNEGGGLGPK